MERKEYKNEWCLGNELETDEPHEKTPMIDEKTNIEIKEDIDEESSNEDGKWWTSFLFSIDNDSTWMTNQLKFTKHMDVYHRGNGVIV